MVGFVDPKSSKPSDKQQESNVEAYLQNPVQIRIPAKGKYSPKTDERCFTWCSQTARGRYEGQEPWCRSICVRRVFEHEVQRLTSHFSRDAAFQQLAAARNGQGQSDSGPSSSGRQDTERFPLPPEGQPASAIPDGIVGGPRSQDVRYWQEGWYVWITKSRWATQERLDLMMFDLERQTAWMRMKEQDQRAWAKADKEERERVQEELNGQESAEPDSLDRPHPYLLSTEESFMMRIPTRLPPLDVYAKRTFSPTWKVLDITRQSVESGHQRDLALHAWELTKEGAPFRLVKNVFKTCFESFRKNEDE